MIRFYVGVNMVEAPFDHVDGACFVVEILYDKLEIRRVEHA